MLDAAFYLSGPEDPAVFTPGFNPGVALDDPADLCVCGHIRAEHHTTGTCLADIEVDGCIGICLCCDFDLNEEAQDA